MVKVAQQPIISDDIDQLSRTLKNIATKKRETNSLLITNTLLKNPMALNVHQRDDNHFTKNVNHAILNEQP